MRHPNSSYVTTKLYGTSTYGGNNTIFQKELFSHFLPSMAARQWPSLGDACQSGKIATLLNSLFFFFLILLLPNYRVKYRYNIESGAVVWYVQIL